VVADGQLVVAGGDGPVLLEAGDGSFHDIAVPVAHGIDHRWPAAPSAPAGPELLLVGPLRDGVGDPPLAQQPPTRRVAVAPVGDQVSWTLAGPTRPRPGHPNRIEQRFQLGALMALASGDQYGQRTAAAITGQMDLGGEPTPAASQGLVDLGSRP
jgi:hypothetical protein